jgi:hypothetical protein
MTASRYLGGDDRSTCCSFIRAYLKGPGFYPTIAPQIVTNDA